MKKNLTILIIGCLVLTACTALNNVGQEGGGISAQDDSEVETTTQDTNQQTSQGTEQEVTQENKQEVKVVIEIPDVQPDPTAKPEPTVTPATAAQAIEVIQNGDFSQGGLWWLVEPENSHRVSFSDRALLNGSTGWAEVYQGDLLIKPDINLALSFSCKAPAGARCTVTILQYDANWQLITGQPHTSHINGTGETVSKSFIFESVGHFAEIYLIASENHGETEIDNVSLSYMETQTAETVPPSDRILCWHGTGEAMRDYGAGPTGHEILISYPKASAVAGISLAGLEMIVPWNPDEGLKRPASWSLKACKVDNVWYSNPEFPNWFWNIQYMQVMNGRIKVTSGQSGGGDIWYFDPILDLNLPLIPTRTTGSTVEIVAVGYTEPNPDINPYNDVASEIIYK